MERAWKRRGCFLVVFAAFLGCALGASAQSRYSVTQVEFPAQSVKAVRLLILDTQDGTQPCIDELEVYAPGGRDNLALSSAGAKASASSCLPGYAIHRIENLNDGQYGNDHSWIPENAGQAWAQIDFAQVLSIGRVVFSRDRTGGFKERRVKTFEIYGLDSSNAWHKIDAVELAGNDPEALPASPVAPTKASPASLAEAFLAEEYAWLKTFGRADFDPAVSTPRYGMERRGPRHAGDDRLPLPRLAQAPEIDGRLSDAAWRGASEGRVRVASLRDFETSPLVECSVRAGYCGKELYLAIAMDRPLGTNIAVLSGADWRNLGVVAIADDGLVFNTFNASGLAKSQPIQGKWNKEQTAFEMRFPRAMFAGEPSEELRVGLGLGGKNTPKQGRPVCFRAAPFYAVQVPSSDPDAFRIRLGCDAQDQAVTIKGNVAALESEAALAPSKPQEILVPAVRGEIGRAFDLELVSDDGSAYTLHLFRYDPAEHVLEQAEALAARRAQEGLDVSAERASLTALRARQRRLLERKRADAEAERGLLYDARLCKRSLFYRDPGLAPVEKVLFEKRYPFNPSHNYSELLDGAWRPGGGIFVLETPRENGRLEPEQARVTRLFDAAGGVARTAMADFDVDSIYFAYRPSKDGYFHLCRMDADGGDPRELTTGPFHDYWPCPLPDGGLAFISTRCKRRFLCWRPQAATLHRMDADGGNIRPLSFANLTEWAPSVMQDGRIVWTRSEYQDKAADFGHTLWAIRPDGTQPELVFGNTITVANGYAYGREVPRTHEIACTLISHFGDLNGPVALLDIDQGRFNPDAISSITPEVFWPGSPPLSECFREPVPISRDLFLCAHAALSRFDLYLIDRWGNRELLYADPDISSQCPTPFLRRTPPPVFPEEIAADASPGGELFVQDVYRGATPEIKRGQAAYIAVSVELTHDLEQLADGAYRNDHEPFQQFYASPSDVLSGPYGWPTYVAKESLGTVPVEADGSAYFKAPSGKVLFFHLLDKDFNELQRMRSVMQLQPGEKRSCAGCHEDRSSVPGPNERALALRHPPSEITPPPWGAVPFSFEEIVQPVLDAKCVSCHNPERPGSLDFSATLDQNKIPASYRTFISRGLVHYADWTWSNPEVCKKLPPLSLGTVRSRLWEVLDAGHHGVRLTTAEMRAIKTWTDLNCPLWGDYVERAKRPAIARRMGN